MVYMTDHAMRISESRIGQSAVAAFCEALSATMRGVPVPTAPPGSAQVEIVVRLPRKMLPFLPQADPVEQPVEVKP